MLFARIAGEGRGGGLNQKSRRGNALDGDDAAVRTEGGGGGGGKFRALVPHACLIVSPRNLFSVCPIPLSPSFPGNL